MNQASNTLHRPLRRTLVLMVLVAACTQLTAQISTSFDFGYSTRSTNLKPVIALNISYALTNAGNYHPLIEIGERGHTDYNADHIIYGHLSTGIMYKQYIAITAGIAYGGNQQKQDRHITADTTIYLAYGNASSHFTDYQLAIRGMINILKNDDGNPSLQLIAQTTYTHQTYFASLGFRIIYNKK